MKKANRINTLSGLSMFIAVCFILSSSSIYAQDIKNRPMHLMKNMNREKTVKIDSAIVHKGIIDLKAIDKNKDGKVFQDQMDWNVISDKPGKCPLCKMELKEVTIKAAQKNLEKYEFKVNQ